MSENVIDLQSRVKDQKAPEAAGFYMNDIKEAQLNAFLKRIETLEGKKADLQADIKDVYAEAKLEGFNVKALRMHVRIRKMEADDAGEAWEVFAHLNLYRKASNDQLLLAFGGGAA